MKNQKNPLSRKEDIVVQEADGEVLIYDLKDNKAFCLNDTSALIWQMCDGTKSVGEISGELGKKLNQPANEDLVWLAIEQLKKENLLVNGKELTNNFEGLSRREVIKRVGLASMIALPVVSSLIAPSAIYAASACTDTVCMCSGGGVDGDICSTPAPTATNGCTDTVNCGVCRRVGVGQVGQCVMS
jgi:hypothetical protein